MAVKTRAALNSDADSALADNAVRAIRPVDVRQRIKDLADSAILSGDVSTFVKTLFDDADAATIYATLGAVPEAQIPARLSAGGKTIPSNDYNLALESGFYKGPGPSVAVNGPPGYGSYGLLLVLRNDAFIVQIAAFGAISGGTTTINSIAMRGSNTNGTVWGNWQTIGDDAAFLTTGILPDARVSTTLPSDKAFRRGNILGSVSESGGVPTGAIIETGANANGSYTRWADGTQICRQIWSYNSSAQTAWGAVFLEGEYLWTFPAAFTNVTETPTPSGHVTSDGSRKWATGGSAALSNTQASFQLFNAIASAPTQCYVALTCIGRWFN